MMIQVERVLLSAAKDYHFRCCCMLVYAAVVDNCLMQSVITPVGPPSKSRYPGASAARYAQAVGGREIAGDVEGQLLLLYSRGFIISLHLHTTTQSSMPPPHNRNAGATGISTYESMHVRRGQSSGTTMRCNCVGTSTCTGTCTSTGDAAV